VRRTALYALLYLLLCGAALTAIPQEASADAPEDTPHNGTFTKMVFLPVTQRGAVSMQSCAATSEAVYDAMPIPVDGGNLAPPAEVNGDVNLALRSYSPTDALRALVEYGGHVDSDAPQIAGMLNPAHRPAFRATYRVHEWEWDRGVHGSRGGPIESWLVTLLELEIARGTPLAAPSRQAEIHSGGFIAFVLYAEAHRITLKYTRQDSIVRGYTVHLEDICVDANLLALYKQLDAAGRQSLPALRNGESLGTVGALPPKIAIRDEGSFMDPRSRWDWWQGY
jgi:hypothetical protein